MQVEDPCDQKAASHVETSHDVPELQDRHYRKIGISGLQSSGVCQWQQRRTVRTSILHDYNGIVEVDHSGSQSTKSVSATEEMGVRTQTYILACHAARCLSSPLIRPKHNTSASALPRGSHCFFSQAVTS